MFDWDTKRRCGWNTRSGDEKLLAKGWLLANIVEKQTLLSYGMEGVDSGFITCIYGLLTNKHMLDISEPNSIHVFIQTSCGKGNEKTLLPAAPSQVSTASRTT